MGAADDVETGVRDRADQLGAAVAPPMAGGGVVRTPQALVGRNRKDEEAVRPQDTLEFVQGDGVVFDMLDDVHAKEGVCDGRWVGKVFGPSLNKWSRSPGGVESVASVL